jgi:hypothetical protein
LFLAGMESLAGKPIDGRVGVKVGAVKPTFPIEERRDAKKWLSEQMVRRYHPTLDQLPLTSMLDLGLVRSRDLRSFRCLERTVSRLVAAVRAGQHVSIPHR